MGAHITAAFGFSLELALQATFNFFSPLLPEQAAHTEIFLFKADVATNIRKSCPLKYSADADEHNF